MLKVMKDGEEIKVRPTGTAGGQLLCERKVVNERGLESREVLMVMAHEAKDHNEWARWYSSLGGGQLYDEDGNPAQV